MAAKGEWLPTQWNRHTGRKLKAKWHEEEDVSKISDKEASVRVVNFFAGVGITIFFGWVLPYAYYNIPACHANADYIKRIYKHQKALDDEKFDAAIMECLDDDGFISVPEAKWLMGMANGLADREIGTRLSQDMEDRIGQKQLKERLEWEAKRVAR